jgi:hypothetical protein
MTKEIPKIRQALFGNPIFSSSLEKINVCLEKFIDPAGLSASKNSWNIGVRDYLPILSEIHESLKELMVDHQLFLNQISNSEPTSSNATTSTAEGAQTAETSQTIPMTTIEPMLPELEESMETTIGMFNTTYRQRGEREVPRESDISVDCPYNLDNSREALSPLQTEYDEGEDLTDEDIDEEEDEDPELVAMEEAMGDNEDDDEQGNIPLKKGRATP